MFSPRDTWKMSFWCGINELSQKIRITTNFLLYLNINKEAKKGKLHVVFLVVFFSFDKKVFFSLPSLSFSFILVISYKKIKNKHQVMLSVAPATNCATNNLFLSSKTEIKKTYVSRKQLVLNKTNVFIKF